MVCSLSLPSLLPLSVSYLLYICAHRCVCEQGCAMQCASGRQVRQDESWATFAGSGDGGTYRHSLVELVCGNRASLEKLRNELLERARRDRKALKAQLKCPASTSTPLLPGSGHMISCIWHVTDGAGAEHEGGNPLFSKLLRTLNEQQINSLPKTSPENQKDKS